MSFASGMGTKMSRNIFLSYAREDDKKPPNKPTADGFVAALYEQLQYEFSRLPHPAPHILRDVDYVRGGDLFDPKIEAALANSTLFIAVLSTNWMISEYCKKELEFFRKCWPGEDNSKFKNRITVVHCNFVERAKHPELLTGQTGYRFFKFSYGGEAPGKEQFFFDRGEMIDDGYRTALRDLAVHLWERSQLLTEARTLAEPAPTSEPLSPQTGQAPEPASPPNIPDVASSARNGRTVYLAKPGADLEAEYQLIAKELTRQGFEIRPSKDDNALPKGSMTGLVDDAMAGCEMSVHLLGRDAGFAFAGEEPLVKLQLARAAKRVGETSVKGKGGFRRVIWAPKVLQTKSGNDSGAPGTKVVERDPVAELQAIDSFLPNDVVDGGGISDFVIFLLQNLDALAPPPPPPPEQETSSAASDCYIYHDNKDLGFARRVFKALRQRGVEPIMPALHGDDGDRMALHRKRLRECDAVVLCWGDAPDTWAQAYSLELKNWKQLGRSKQFKVRGLVVGPPPEEVKTDIEEFWPKSEIDVVIPVPSLDGLSPENLARLGLGTVE